MDRSLRGRFATSLSEHRHEMPAAAGASFGRAGRRGSDPGGEVDYAEEGRKLLALVNLDVSEHHTTVMRYAPYNAMYKHPSGGGILYVGNEQIAKDKRGLQQLNISRIVFCQDADGRCHFHGEDWVEYHAFSIGRWRSQLGMSPTPAATLRYFEPHLAWIEGELATGRHVLVHCLAGAHRAGTCGIASLMWLLNIPSSEAIPLAQRLRPVIEPIGGYPMLLQLLSDALAPRRGASAPPLLVPAGSDSRGDE